MNLVIFVYWGLSIYIPLMVGQKICFHSRQYYATDSFQMTAIDKSDSYGKMTDSVLLNDLNRLGKNISKRKNSGNLRNNSKQPFVEISEEYLKMNLWPELTIQSWNTVILKKWKELSTYCKCMSGRTLDTFGVRRAILYLIKFSIHPGCSSKKLSLH